MLTILMQRLARLDISMQSVNFPSVVVLSVAAPLLPLKILPATSVISPEKFKQKVESGLGQSYETFFSSSPTLRQSKLECFALECFSSSFSVAFGRKVVTYQNGAK
jgi:hypothetical protein